MRIIILALDFPNQLTIINLVSSMIPVLSDSKAWLCRLWLWGHN